jgi:hypothetical protein
MADPEPITAEMLQRSQFGEVDPISLAVDPGPPVETMESLGITASVPYPEGSPAIPPAAGVPHNEAPPETAPVTP